MAIYLDYSYLLPKIWLSKVVNATDLKIGHPYLATSATTAHSNALATSSTGLATLVSMQPQHSRLTAIGNIGDGVGNIAHEHCFQAQPILTWPRLLMTRWQHWERVGDTGRRLSVETEPFLLATWWQHWRREWRGWGWGCVVGGWGWGWGAYCINTFQMRLLWYIYMYIYFKYNVFNCDFFYIVANLKPRYTMLWKWYVFEKNRRAPSKSALGIPKL